MRSARSGFLAVFVAACAAALITFQPTRDPDTWWHLATGRLALATRSTLPTDPFSFSFYGAAWRYKDLVADGLIWLAYRGGGFVGLWLGAAVAGAAMALGWHLVTRRTLPILVALAVTLPLLPWAMRPNLLSLALFPTLLALIQRRRSALPLVVVSWLWIILHRAALLGYVLLLARAVQLGLARLCARRPRLSLVAGAPPSSRELVEAAIAAGVAPLVGLLNPAGRAAFTSAVDVAGSAVLRVYIAEWKQLGLGALANWSGALGGVAIAVVVVRLVVAVRRHERAPFDSWHLGLLTLFAALSTQSVRWLPYLTLASALVLVIAIDEVAPRLPGPRALAATMLTIVIIAAGAGWARHGAAFALGEERAVEPADALDFARAHRLDGPLVHSYEFGGYLLWRGVPVLVDGRLDQLYPPAFVATCIQAERNPRFLAQLPLENATWAIGSNGDARFTHRYLFADPRWMMVYWSDAASVYVVRAAHPELASLAFGAIDPAAPERSAAEAARSGDAARIGQALGELRRMVTASPTSIRANSALAILFHVIGRSAERDVVMRVLHAVAPDHPAIRELDRRFGAH